MCYNLAYLEKGGVGGSVKFPAHFDPVCIMNGERPSSKGLLQPHVHYSFLKTASEGLSQDESESESLAQEIEYQFELQKRINKTEEMVDQSYEEEEAEESLEEDSLEEKYFSGEESDVDETHVPNGTRGGKENCINASDKKNVAGQYSELRYNPNWKNDKERTSFLGSDDSCQECAENSPTLSLDSVYSPSQFGLTYRTHPRQESARNVPPGFDVEFLNSCDPIGKVIRGAYRVRNKEEEGTACRDDSGPRTNSDSYSPHIKGYKKRSEPETDFVEKNKLTLGLAAQQKRSYLQLHSKKQKGGHQGQAHPCRKPDISGINSSHATSVAENPFSEISVQSPLETQAELRSQKDRCHNVLESDHAHASSNSYREVSDWEQESRLSLHHTFNPNLSVAPLHPSIIHSSSWGHHYPTDPNYSVHPNGKQQSMSVTFARHPLEPNPYPDFQGLPLPSASEKKKINRRKLESTSGASHLHPYRCTVSEPPSSTRHGKHQNLVECRSFSPASKVGFPPLVNKDVSSGNPRRIYVEKTSISHVSDNSRPSQPPAHRLIQADSPTTRLIQAAEEQHLKISRLAHDYLAGSQCASMLPPIMLRGESDSRLNLESCEGSPRVLNRSNSEGCLLQMEKEKEKKDKEKRQSYRTKGYMKMDVKLGGLGPDYEAVKEKSEKVKQQKEYARHIQENNMKNIANSRKPQPRLENKLGASRQKALEYAKTIPKPKLFVSRPSEPEPKDERNLARTLNGENLPPISSLESLQNRHEKEKQVVAAFKTLHIV
uniref:Jhy protein homolog isoform X1 n=2 Tax=Pogona vitticeps TaxID=103695 RepID=A0ABM5EQ46_9SAUR